MQDTIAKFKEEKRAEFLKNCLLNDPKSIWSADPDLPGRVADFWLSQIPSLLTLLEEHVGETNYKKLVEGEFSTKSMAFVDGVAEERRRTKKLLSLTKQQF